MKPYIFLCWIVLSANVLVAMSEDNKGKLDYYQQQVTERKKKSDIIPGAAYCEILGKNYIKFYARETANLNTNDHIWQRPELKDLKEKYYKNDIKQGKEVFIFYDAKHNIINHGIYSPPVFIYGVDLKDKLDESVYYKIAYISNKTMYPRQLKFFNEKNQCVHCDENFEGELPLTQAQRDYYAKTYKLDLSLLEDK